MKPLLEGKRALVVGVANERSLAWAIAQAFKAEGAELVFTYPGAGMEKRVRPLAEEIGARGCFDMDVGKDADLENVAKELGKLWPQLDVMVHAVAFAPREALDGRFVEATSREAFRVALDISAYSLIGMARAFKPMMKPGSSIVTLTYAASEKVVTHYNVMAVAKSALETSMRYLAHDLGQDGIRVNAISAGPVKTLAAAGISGFRAMLAENAQHTPLKRNIDQADVGTAALYLCSDMAHNVTGEVLHVDAGQNILAPVGM